MNSKKTVSRRDDLKGDREPGCRDDWLSSRLLLAKDTGRHPACPKELTPGQLRKGGQS